MACNEIQTLLAGYSAGDLSDRESLRVREHLGVCEACQREWKALLRTIHALDAFEDREPPRDLWPAIRARIEENAARRAQRPAWVETLVALLWPRRVAATAAVAVVAVVTFMAIHQNGTVEPPTVSRPLPAHSSTFVRGYVLTSNERPLSDPVAMGMLAMVTENHEYDAEKR